MTLARYHAVWDTSKGRSKEKKDEKNCVQTFLWSGVGFGALDALEINLANIMLCSPTSISDGIIYQEIDGALEFQNFVSSAAPPHITIMLYKCVQMCTSVYKWAHGKYFATRTSADMEKETF